MIQAFEDQVPALPEEYYVADSAMVLGNVALGSQASVWFGSVLRGDIEPITIGARSNIQDNSVAHTSRNRPVRVGSDVTVGHNVILHGCTIGDNCLIGMGAILLDGFEIGDNCIIGAGSLVPIGRKIPPGSLAVGAPCKVIRALSEADFSDIRSYAARYVALQARYRNGGLRKIQ